MELDNLKDPDGKPVNPGTVAFDNALSNSRSRLVKQAKGLGGTIKAGDIDAGLQELVDENFTAKFETKILDEQGNIDPVKWEKFEKEHGISLFDLKSKKTPLASFTTFEANLVRKLTGIERKVSIETVGLGASQVLMNIPGYANARLIATLKKKSQENVQQVTVKHEALLEKALGEFDLEQDAKGAVRLITTYLRTNHADAYKEVSETELIDELHETRKNLHAAYPGLIEDLDPKSETFGAINHRAILELDRVMLKMYAISHVQIDWYSEFVGPPVTKNDFFWKFGQDISISNLKPDQLREATDPYLKNFLGGKVIVDPDKKKKDAEKAIKEGAETGIWSPNW